ARAAAENPRVVAAAPFVEGQGLLSADGAARGVLVRGVLPQAEDRVADFSQNMVTGRVEALQPGSFGIVLGADLARALRVLPGDKLALIAPQGIVTPAGLVPRLKQFTVVGTFDVGFNEADAGLALIHLEDAQRLYQLDHRVSGVRLKLVDLFEARKVGRELVEKDP